MECGKGLMMKWEKSKRRRKRKEIMKMEMMMMWMEIMGGGRDCEEGSSSGKGRLRCKRIALREEWKLRRKEEQLFSPLGEDVGEGKVF